jgi:threonylcarbamoyladenosine tRNA methylthiotransferase MtaB
MSKMKTYKIATLGCRTNQYESEAYQNQLKHAGYREALGDEEADLCIVNTCTVTHSADSHSRNQIRKLRKKYPKAHIAVTGCMVEKNKEALLEIPEANWVISNKNKEQLLNQIYPQESFPEFALEEVNSQTRAFVKIQDGCNSYCSYCIIPYVRGRSKSRTLAEILKEVKTLISNGVKELVLTGINIGDFDGNDSSGSTRLCHLVQAVDQLEGLERIRISSIDPDEVDQELIETLKQGKKTCKSMHIVLQSGSNWILKRMNRKYTKQNFFETIDRLKALSADFTFTTDIIVGFPGEREIDFQDTLEVMKEVRFAKVHMFPYSKRERTKAALFSDPVPTEIIQERKNILLHLAEQLSFELRASYVGRTLQILTEGSDSGEFEKDTVGHSDNFLKVILLGQKYPTNTLVNVRIINNSPAGLIGKAIL